MKNSMPELPAAFPPPEKSGRPDFLFVAGEHSGDELSAEVITHLLEKNPSLKIAAFGGNDMRAAGAQLLFNMTTFSAVGLIEVLSNFNFYRKLFARIIAWVDKYRPRAVCFTDFPGMNLRLEKALTQRGLSRKGGGDIALYHYVSPQIWAWKTHRRFEMEKNLDSLGVLFPFEKKCYADTTLDVHFVGDPFAAPTHILPVCYAADAPVLLLPGSRPKPVARIFPILLGAWRIFKKTHADKRAVVLHPGEPVLGILQNLLKKNPDIAPDITLVPVDSVAKNPQPASAVLMSSGTMSRTCSLAGVPGAILYCANPITWAFGSHWVGNRVRFLGMANLLLDRNVYPEFLQKDATSENLAASLNECFDNPKVLETLRRDRDELYAMLRPKPGAHDAATWLLTALDAPAGTKNAAAATIQKTRR